MNFHVRIHKLLSEDKTSFVHNHPFNYISIILSGGYSEEVLVGDKLIAKKHGFGKILFRSSKTYHRITSVKDNTKTLFIAFGKKIWDLKLVGDIGDRPLDGVYKRIIKDKKVYCKCKNGMYYIGHDNILKAEAETRYSIFQDDTYIKKW